MKTPMAYHFCLDIGGTGTRGALLDIQGTELCRAKGPAGALSLGSGQCYLAIDDVWAKINKYCEQELEAGPIEQTQVKLSAGIAGIGLPGLEQELEDMLSNFGQVQLFGDGFATLVATTKGKPGALISVGTGIGALSLNARNEIQSVSSWGFPAGDAGSGAWIGLRLFGDFLKALDGIVLTPQIEAHLIDEILAKTGREPNTIMQWHNGAQPKDFAALAPIVVAGAKNNSAYCNRILDEAAQKICRVANALVVDAEQQIFLGGGLGNVLHPYCMKQEPAIKWTQSNADPIEGVFLISTAQVPEPINLPRLGLR